MATTRYEQRHAEAFRLMTYQADDRTETEIIWNSRDGVTPFVITLRSGKTATHINWRLDPYAPDHKPAVGDRIFINLTPERMRVIATSAARRFWVSDPERRANVPYLDGFASFEQLEQYLIRIHEQEYDKHAPDLIEVTEELARERGWL